MKKRYRPLLSREEFSTVLAALCREANLFHGQADRVLRGQDFPNVDSIARVRIANEVRERARVLERLSERIATTTIAEIEEEDAACTES